MSGSGNFAAQHIVDVKINAQSDPEGDHHCTGDWSTSATVAGSDGIKTLSSCPRTAPCNAAQDGEWISGTAGQSSNNYTACVVLHRFHNRFSQ